MLACSCVSQNDYIWFIDRLEINAYLKKATDYSSLIFSSETPFVIESVIAIPLKKETNNRKQTVSDGR